MVLRIAAILEKLTVVLNGFVVDTLQTRVKTSMKKNPIRKMHVGWTSPWIGSNKKPESIRRWVAICPQCNTLIQAKNNMYYGYITQDTRKSAKDELYRHTLVFH